jgi:hypothetical protein
MVFDDGTLRQARPEGHPALLFVSLQTRINNLANE